MIVVAFLAIAGAADGGMQWLVLRRWVAHAGWWIVASAASWIVVTYVYVYITRANEMNLLLGGAVSGAISGAIMGTVLVWLIRAERQRRSVPAGSILAN
jgi:uncharacterized membrane protein YjfL (UPF0719 family)